MRMPIALLLFSAGCSQDIGVTGDQLVTAQHQDIGVRGLMTDPSPDTVPDGALSEADNVVFRRDGMAEPRPGFAKADATIGLDTLEAIIPYDGTTVRVGQIDGDVNESNTYDGEDGDDATPVFTAAVTIDPHDALTWDRDNIRGLETRGNLYLTTQDKMRRLTAGDDPVALPVGLIPPNVTALDVDTPDVGFLANNYYVSYRVTMSRIDENGLVTESAPSGSQEFKNVSGFAKNVQLTIDWHEQDGIVETADNFVSGTKIRIYRSAQSATAPPPTEYFLAFETWIATGDSGQAVVVDLIPEDRLGAALYTNETATNGGAQAANFRMPPAKDLALYKGSLFAANVVDFPRRSFTYLYSGDVSGEDDGIGYRAVTGHRANGSPHISVVVDPTGLRVGMALNDNTDWDVATPDTPVVIIGIIAPDVLTMSAEWTGATDTAPTSVPLTFFDTVCVGSPSDPANHHVVIPNYLVTSILNGIDGQSIASPDAFAFASGSMGANYLTATPSDPQFTSITLEGYTAEDGDSFLLSATHGNEYLQPLPLSGTGADTAPTADADCEEVTATPLHNVIMWSKTDEPEHHKLSDKLYVGNQQSPNLRIFAANDAVWVLKGKGDRVYRLSGAGAVTGFRLDAAASAYLLHPGLACSFADPSGTDVVFAWTDKGAVLLGDGGLIPISRQVIGNQTSEIEQVLDHEIGAGFSAFAVCNEKEYEIVVGLPDVDATAGDPVARVFVYNAHNKGWSTWFGDADGADLQCAAYNTATRLLQFGATTDSSPRIERSTTDDIATADNVYVIDIQVIDINDDGTGAIQIVDPVAGWTITVGDLIQVDDVFGIILSVESETQFTTTNGQALSDALGEVAQLAYSGFTSRIKWTPRKEGGGLVKRFHSLVTHWDDTRGLYSWSTVLEGARNTGTEITQNYTRTYQRDVQLRDDTRALVPITVALNTQVYPSLVIRNADSRWRVTGLTTYFNPATERVSR